MAQLGVGELAPDFTLPDQLGHGWTLSLRVANGPVVLFFYPKNDTPVCLVEACTFRDQHEVFLDHGAQVVGVSADSVASHERYRNRRELPFTLLSDEHRHVRSLYGVKRNLGFFDGRVTFLIDQNRLVRHVSSSAFDGRSHVSEALVALNHLQG